VRLFRESYERESTTPSRHRDNVGQIVRLLLKGAETGGGDHSYAVLEDMAFDARPRFNV
jgi:hypothetical protein